MSPEEGWVAPTPFKTIVRINVVLCLSWQSTYVISGWKAEVNYHPFISAFLIFFILFFIIIISAVGKGREQRQGC